MELPQAFHPESLTPPGLSFPGRLLRYDSESTCCPGPLSSPRLLEQALQVTLSPLLSPTLLPLGDVCVWDWASSVLAPASLPVGTSSFPESQEACGQSCLRNRRRKWGPHDLQRGSCEVTRRDS